MLHALFVIAANGLSFNIIGGDPACLLLDSSMVGCAEHRQMVILPKTMGLRT